MNFSFGKFYGRVQQQTEVAGVGLTETVYPAYVRLPPHAHNSPYFCFVVNGNYTETFGPRERLCGPRTLVFHPAGETHSNRFGKAGGLCLNLEFSPAWEKRIGEISPVFDKHITFNDFRTTKSLILLQRELHLMDNLAPLAIESLVLEIIVGTARLHALTGSAPTSPPVWLKRAEEFIRAHFAESLTLNQVGAEIKRHPVHMVREFRRYYGCTIGEYVRRLRLQSACERLSRTDEPLVMIALSCGFANQAHFSTFFKRATGMSPTQYRDLLRAR
jgi:AraC family transcriptional regulator